MPETPEKRGPGQPTKFTPDRVSRLLGALRDGNHIETACAVAGVSYRCYRDWVTKGEAEGEGEFYQFSQDVTRALADAETALLANVKTHSADDWRAGAWILERRHPDRWANTQRVRLEVEKELRSVLEALEAKMSPGAYRELIDALAGLGEDRTGEEGAA